MTQISTISEFLLQAGTEYRVYDLARGIRSISEQSFLEMENAILAPPCPRQQHAWIGLIFWNKQLSEQHYIWFLKLPLDERGLVSVAARNHFLQIIIEALGKQLEHANSNAERLAENPYSFVPTEPQLANFNSISRRDLKLGFSNSYQQALNYIHAPSGQDWQHIPLQGITDFVAQISQEQTTRQLMESFDLLPDEVRNTILNSLENQPISIQLSEFLVSWLLKNMNERTNLIAGLRALSQSLAEGLLAKPLIQILASQMGQDPDILTIIAARHWGYLSDPKILQSFINNLAEQDIKYQIFSPIFRDLVQIPMLRDIMLGVLRWPQKEKALTTAIGQLFSVERS